MRTWNMTPKRWIGIAGLLLLILWWGVPSFNKWRADRLVDELCAKDGGIKVYETVILPKERFNQWGQFVVLEKRIMKPDDEYYTVWKTTDIIGKHNSSDIFKLTVYQHYFAMYRVADNKLLSEAIGYSRRGGDPFGALMPSAYSRPENIESEITKLTFLQSK